MLLPQIPAARDTSWQIMSTYKLIYFDAKGRAEVTRFIFAQAGVQYEDKRVVYGTTQEEWKEWKELKPNTPYGELPVLEVDGKQFAGSGPIARFVAERFNLAGSNDFENADIASIIVVLDALTQKLTEALFEKDETRKADLKKALEEEHIPKNLGALEKRAAGNNSANGWIWGAKVTYAELSAYHILSYAKMVSPNVLDKYPALAKMYNSVENLPNIAKWLEERPKTEY